MISLLVASLAWAKPTSMLVVPPTDVKYAPLDPKMPGGPQVAVVFGDLTKKGPVGFFFKVPGGFRPGPHTHSSDDYVVVVSGKVHNFSGTNEGAAVGAGGHWFQPGNVVHDNHCEDGEECVIFIYTPNGFDFKPAAK